MPKKVKRKKGRVIWAVCAKKGGDFLDINFFTKKSDICLIDGRREEVVKFVECLTD